MQAAAGPSMRRRPRGCSRRALFGGKYDCQRRVREKALETQKAANESVVALTDAVGRGEERDL